MLSTPKGLDGGDLGGKEGIVNKHHQPRLLQGQRKGSQGDKQFRGGAGEYIFLLLFDRAFFSM